VCMRLIIINNPNLFGLRKIQKWQRLVDLSMRLSLSLTARQDMISMQISRWEWSKYVEANNIRLKQWEDKINKRACMLVFSYSALKTTMSK
jgi:hypothetical protein